MSLPTSYCNEQEYFNDILSFLQDYEWMYNFPNIDVLVLNILIKIPSDWISYLKNTDNLKNIPLGIITDEQPDTLQHFLRKLNKLKPSIEQEYTKCDYQFEKNSRLDEKKLHEILSLAPVINDITKKYSTTYILDVGSGLGYLCNLLSHRYGLKILGVEGSEEKIKLAEKNKKGDVVYVHHFITDESLSFLSKQLDILNFENVCITGLHACADLSVTTLNLFLKLEKVKSLVIMPCCYHRFKMKLSNETEIFESFPVSQGLKKKLSEVQGGKFIRTPFLRLACQQTSSSFKSRDQLFEASKNLLYRSVLQKAAHRAKCKISRTKRKSGKSIGVDFGAYVKNLKNTHKLEGGKKIDDEAFERLIYETWASHEEDLPLIEALLSFQIALQSVSENFLLLDRVAFLRERGVNCCVKKITDDALSPRCYALIASK